MDPEQQRIRDYLQAQAAKLTVLDTVRRVRADMPQVLQAMVAVPPDRFTESPAAGEWAPNQVIGHLVRTSQRVAEGITQVLRHGNTPAAVTDGEMANTVQDPVAWWRQLAVDRELLFARVLEARPDTHLDIRWGHPMFGPLNWREWLLFTRLHDLDHARQVQSIAAQFAASGRS